MSIFCCSLPYTWNGDGDTPGWSTIEGCSHLDRPHEDAVVGGHDGSSARAPTTEYFKYN